MPNSPPIGGESAATLCDLWPYLLVAAAVGLASGFQSIHQKFGSAAPSVLKTWSGCFYWLSRGAVPAIAYMIWRHTQRVPNDSFMWAIGCGLGSEMVLRSRFYLADRKTPGGKIEEVSKGVFDLVNWYQVLFLKISGDKLADERRKYNEKLMADEADFPKLCSRARSNAGAWAIEEDKQRLLSLISRLQADFKSASKGLSGEELQRIHKTFILEFGYAAMALVSRKSLETLIK